MDSTIWVVLSLGLLLGVRHAFDPDHLVAVSTIVSEYRNPLKAIWIGVSWGLGHTTTLLLAGVLVLMVKLSLPDRVALFFEFGVGIMLVFLGTQIFWSFRKRRVHLHSHEYQESSHLHLHSHADSEQHAHHKASRVRNWAYFLIAGISPGEHGHSRFVGPGKPFFRLKSYVVGTIHGLAGSAALMLLVLAGLKSSWTGVSYILVFGLGSIASMGAITFFISLPFSVSARLPRLNKAVQFVAGAFSILFGLFLMYEVGIGEGLFGHGLPAN
ncbi:MAG: urease accessory protein UreH [Chloroflexi bacterium]|nr:urease accessory protein UreH [Chloroflexota bacterium]